MKRVIKILIVFGLVASASVFTITDSAFASTPKNIETYHVDKNYNIVPNDKKSNKKIILITIDDGPGKTDKDLVNTLKKHNTPAIFFINGNNDKRNPGNIKMIYDAGFTIGNHTWSHVNLKKSKNEKIKKEIEDNSKLIEKITGEKPKFFRAPYGMANPYSKEIVKNEGMIFMNWSGSALDWEKGSRDEKVFLKNISAGLHDGEIILLHGHPWTTKYLDKTLTTLEQKGYSFVDPKNITQ